MGEDEGVRREVGAAEGEELARDVSVRGEHPDGSVVERDAPFGVGLGALLDHVALQLDERSGDVQDAAVEVEMAPAEGAQLTATGACGGGQTDEDGKAGWIWAAAEMSLVMSAAVGISSGWRWMRGGVATTAGLEVGQPHRTPWRTPFVLAGRLSLIWRVSKAVW